MGRHRRGGRGSTPPARLAAMASWRTYFYPTGTPSRRRLHRWRECVRCCADSAKKLKRTGAVPSLKIASQRCCVRAARAFLLGHRAVVAFWSVCCSVLRVGGRAQSVPARRPQFFTGVLRSQRQSCHKLVVAFRALYRRALAPAKPQLIEWAFGKMASRPAPRRIAPQGDVPRRPRNRYGGHGSPRGQNAPS